MVYGDIFFPLAKSRALAMPTAVPPRPNFLRKSSPPCASFCTDCGGWKLMSLTSAAEAVKVGCVDWFDSSTDPRLVCFWRLFVLAGIYAKTCYPCRNWWVCATLQERVWTSLHFPLTKFRKHNDLLSIFFSLFVCNFYFCTFIFFKTPCLRLFFFVLPSFKKKSKEREYKKKGINIIFFCLLFHFFFFFFFCTHLTKKTFWSVTDWWKQFPLTQKKSQVACLSANASEKNTLTLKTWRFRSMTCNWFKICVNRRLTLQRRQPCVLANPNAITSRRFASQHWTTAKQRTTRGCFWHRCSTGLRMSAAVITFDLWSLAERV